MKNMRAAWKRIVLSESYARKLFGSADVIGKGVMINQVEYRVAGVVEDVSSVMTMTCADAWVPVSSVPALVEAGEPNDRQQPLSALICWQRAQPTLRQSAMR